MKPLKILIILSLPALSPLTAKTQEALVQATTSLAGSSLKGDEKISTPFGIVELQDNYPTDESSKILFDTMDLQRATQAYIWSTPLVSFTTWRDQQNEHYGPNTRGTFAVYASYQEKKGVVTGNLTTPYIIGFNDLTDGPMQIDYPAGKTAGGFMDFWQRPITDIGLSGPDKGMGGRYLIVGPNDDPEKYKKDGVYVFQSATNNIFLGLRLFQGDPDFKKAFKAGVKISALGGEPAETVFIEGLDKEWSGTSPRGLDYWKTLHQILNEEPVREQDKVWMAMLEPLGIVKGQTFSPDERQIRILKEGAALGELMARNLQVNPRFAEPYWKGTQWYKSFDFTTSQDTETKVELDERTTWFYEAVTSTEAMVNPKVGEGQVYMTTKRDSRGNLVRADKTYRLRVPADVPVGQFWALTLYSENTRRPYDSGQNTIRSANLGSNLADLKKNDDGSVDLFIGPEAPAGFERNWMKTVKDDGWFVYFRLYAPLQPFFDKSFSLPDFEIIE
jgi:hypothetical protein